MTQATLKKDIVRAWHVYDMQGKVLGRAAVEVAHLLMGKGKPQFVRHLDCGDNVVVVNAKDMKVTGKKIEEKKYYRHSGYPSGLRNDTLKELIVKNPAKVFEHAVGGMLPQNKLKATMLKRLHVYAGAEHPYSGKIK